MKAMYSPLSLTLSVSYIITVFNKSTLKTQHTWNWKLQLLLSSVSYTVTLFPRNTLKTHCTSKLQPSLIACWLHGNCVPQKYTESTHEHCSPLLLSVSYMVTVFHTHTKTLKNTEHMKVAARSYCRLATCMVTVFPRNTLKTQHAWKLQPSFTVC